MSRRQPLAAGLAQLAGMLQPSMGKAMDLPRCIATMHVGACLWAKCTIRPVSPAPDATGPDPASSVEPQDGLVVLAVTSAGILYEWAVSVLRGPAGPKCVLQGQHRLPCHAAEQSMDDNVPVRPHSITPARQEPALGETVQPGSADTAGWVCIPQAPLSSRHDDL